MHYNIDYILISSKFRSGTDIGSDHNMVLMILKLKLNAIIKVTSTHNWKLFFF
jgi:hypothetical protein